MSAMFPGGTSHTLASYLSMHPCPDRTESGGQPPAPTVPVGRGAPGRAPRPKISVPAFPVLSVHVPDAPPALIIRATWLTTWPTPMMESPPPTVPFGFGKTLPAADSLVAAPQ